MDLVELTAWDKFNLGKREQREHPDLIVTLAPGSVVRVAFGTRFGDTDGFFLSGNNLVYYETDLIERAPRDDEEHPFSYLPNRENPDVIYAIEIPPIEDLREAARDGNLDAFDGLTAPIPDANARDRIVTRLQENIEHWDLYSTKLSRWRGYPDDSMLPEWTPEHSDHDQEMLHEMATQRHDTHLVDWGEILTIPYHEYFQARLRILNIHEPNLEWYEMVALDVAGAEDQSYCRECGGIQAEDAFLHVQPMPERKPDRTNRICESCADHRTTYSERAVTLAKDERAQRIGGQRRLYGFEE